MDLATASHEEKSLFTDIKKDCNEFRSTRRENLNKKEIYLDVCIIFAGAVTNKKFIAFKHIIKLYLVVKEFMKKNYTYSSEIHNDGLWY